MVGWLVFVSLVVFRPVDWWLCSVLAIVVVVVVVMLFVVVCCCFCFCHTSRVVLL
jgi:hypothetical protein